jgi:hypothetical protein
MRYNPNNWKMMIQHIIGSKILILPNHNLYQVLG